MARRIDTPVTGATPNLPGSLTAAARPLEEGIEWEAYGTAHVPENCAQGWVWQRCSRTGELGVGGEEVEKPLNEGVEGVEFVPFLVEFNAEACAGLPAEWPLLEARARRGLAGRAGSLIARAFSSAAPDGFANENPSLPLVGQNFGFAGVGLVDAVAVLMREAYDCGLTGELFFHAPAWTMPYWFDNALITQVGGVFKMGPHTVVLDQGYTNEPPTGEAEPAWGEAWIYVTGPVEIATGPVHSLDTTTRGVDTRLNRAGAVAAQLAMYRYDPCCVIAAIVSVAEEVPDQ